MWGSLETENSEIHFFHLSGLRIRKFSCTKPFMEDTCGKNVHVKRQVKEVMSKVVASFSNPLVVSLLLM